MAKKTKEPERPARLKDRVRVCGRWQAKGYVASAEEQAKWKQRCKDRDWDPKTGKAKVDNTAPAQQ